MEFTVKSGSPEKQRSACVVVGIYEPRRLSPAAEELDTASDGFISGLLRRGDMEGKPGQSLLLTHVPGVLCDRVLLIGLGREREVNDNAFRQAATVMANRLQEAGAAEAVSYLSTLHVKGRDTLWRVRETALSVSRTLYRFDRLKSRKEEPRRPLRRLTISVPNRRELAGGESAVREASAIAEGVSLARDLGNLPGNICTPTYLADQAQALSKEHGDVKVQVLEKQEMESLGMGALLSVARGSRQPPKLIIMEYRGGPADQKPIALVGKGITFDSGGISIKPGAAMDEMKFDMCGAASVFGAMKACATLKLPINVIGVVPASENLPDGDASKPGDIVTTMSGQTVEILNTDAEGRLVLCDALTYTERFEPQAVIDIATLTGACIIALGHQAHALLGNNNPLSNDLLSAGRKAGDRAWELPLWDEYQEQLKSNFADMANIGGRPAGSITAACFLSRFTKKFRWAHLDVAGTAWTSGDSKGATGRPVRLPRFS
jgi:leucyl aminopeptidase